MGGGSKSPDYSGQAAAAKAEADKIRAEQEKAKADAEAKSLAERTAQANQDSQAAAKRRLLISQSLDDKAQALDSQNPADRVDAQVSADATEEDPLGLEKKKKKTLLGA